MPYHLSSFGPGDYGHSTSSYIPPPLPLPEERHLSPPFKSLPYGKKKKPCSHPAILSASLPIASLPSKVILSSHSPSTPIHTWHLARNSKSRAKSNKSKVKAIYVPSLI